MPQASQSLGTDVRESLGREPRIVVLRALPGVGDLLCAVPALRALRAAHHLATITLAGLRSAAWFVHRYPDLVDDLLVVEGVSGLPEVEADPSAAVRFSARARASHFDLALQLHGNGVVSNHLLAQLGARECVGAHVPGHWEPPWTSIPYPDDRPEILRMLAVTAAAGCSPQGTCVDLPVTDSERRRAAELLDRAGIRGDGFACIHPGASSADRRWAARSFARVAEHLAAHGLAIVLTGTAGETGVVGDVLQAMQGTGVDLAGRTGLGDLAALYRRARLVVTNDTGASHVAAGVRAPSVVVTASDTPQRWAPLDGARHRVVTGEPSPRWPDVDAVIAAIEAQLRRWPGVRDRHRRSASRPPDVAAVDAGGRQ